MNQSRWESFEETAISTVTGFVVSLAIQLIFFPIFNVHLELHNNILLTIIFTIASIVRGYFIRRYYNRRKKTITRIIMDFVRKLK